MAEITPPMESSALNGTGAQRFDDERPPRPSPPPVPSSAGYRSARWPIMVGLSLITAGIGLAAIFSGTRCYYPDERYTNADAPAAVSFGLGLSLTIAGSIRLARLPGPRRHPRLAGAILGTVLMSSLTLGALSLFQFGSWIGCISS